MTKTPSPRPNARRMSAPSSSRRVASAAVAVAMSLALLGPFTTGPRAQGQPQGGVSPISPFPFPRQAPQTPFPQPQTGGQDGQRGLLPSARSPYREGWQGIDSSMPTHQGFPSYGVSVPSFGRYPGVGSELPGVVARPPMPVIPRDQTKTWPSWVRLPDTEKPLASLSAGAILVRQVDRVWLRDPQERAFTPLAHFDKFRLLVAGSDLRVRDGGEFPILFHDGSFLRSVGTIDMSVVDLADDAVTLKVRELRELWSTSFVRPLALQFDNGGTLGVPAGAAIRLSTTRLPAGTVQLRILNQGHTALIWQSPLGTVEVAAGRRIDVMLAVPTGPAITLPLAHEGRVDVRRNGRTAVVSGDGTLVWSGVRIRLRNGERAVVDPLAGKTFPEDPRVPPPTNPEAKADPSAPSDRDPQRNRDSQPRSR